MSSDPLMSQIPEDVMQQARKAAAELGVYSDGLHTDVIARAILSDRSRSIAETGGSEPTPQTHLSAPEAAVEDAAKLLCKWIGYAWDGAGETDRQGEFPDWCHNSYGGLSLQGGKPALRRIATQMLACAPSPQTHVDVPKGWKLVPIEPVRQQMFDAAFNLSGLFGPDFVEANKDFALAVYAAMVSAAPRPPQQQMLPDAIDHINRLIVALKPFLEFSQNVEYDEVLDTFSWKSGIHRNAVSVCFGPSDFAYAAFAVKDTRGCIAALAKEGGNNA